MNREEAKQFADIILRYSKGEEVEVKMSGGGWKLTDNPRFDCGYESYRIKSLICDKAKEAIEANKSKKMFFRTESEQMSKEVQDFCFSIGIDWGHKDYMYLDAIGLFVGYWKTNILAGACDLSDKTAIEINLKTGEVIHPETEVDKQIREVEEKLNELKEARKKEKGNGAQR